MCFGSNVPSWGSLLETKITCQTRASGASHHQFHPKMKSREVLTFWITRQQDPSVSLGCILSEGILSWQSVSFEPRTQVHIQKEKDTQWMIM
jgi:hypothetical protein